MEHLDLCSDPLQSFLAHPSPCPLPVNPVPVATQFADGLHKKLTQNNQGRLKCGAASGQRHSVGQLRCVADQHEAGWGTVRAEPLQWAVPTRLARRGDGDTHPSAHLHELPAAPTSHLLAFGAAAAGPDIQTLARCNYNRRFFRGIGARNWNRWFCTLLPLYFTSFSPRNVKMFCDVHHGAQMK